MRELDVILDRFLEQSFDQLDGDARHAFAALLERQDTDLYAWLTGKACSDDPALQGMVDRIVASSQQ